MKKMMAAIFTTMVIVSGGMADQIPDPDTFFKSEQGKLLTLQQYTKTRGEIFEGKYGGLSQNVQSLETSKGIMNVNYKWQTFFYRIETVKIPDSILFYSMMRATDAEPLKVFNQLVEGKKISNQQREAVADALIEYHSRVSINLIRHFSDDGYSTAIIEAIIDLERWDVVADLITYYENPNGYKKTFKKKHPEYVKIFDFEAVREGRHHEGSRMD